jgi:hypothetical protein
MNPSRTETPEFVPTAFLPDPYAIRQDPALRWRRVEHLVGHRRRPFYGRDDPATWLAWRFRRLLGHCHTKVRRECLARWFPALDEAYRFHTAVEPFKRWELEARLLAGETDGVIAARCGMTVGGVQAYHDRFYAVRSCLPAAAYVLTVLLGGKSCVSVEPDDHETLLKSIAYQFGGRELDRVLRYLRDPPTVPESLDGLDLDTLKDLHARLRTRIVVLLETTPPSAVSPATWMWLQQRCDKATGAAQSNGEANVMVATRAVLDVATCLSDFRRPTAGAVVPDPFAVPA